jgi:hypothetical protein
MKTLIASLLLAAIATPALAEDVQFTLNNKSEYQIDEFYASPGNDDEWGEDILGKDVLSGGESATITIADGSDQCVYDLKAIDEDKVEHVLNDLNICEEPDVNFDK